MSDEPGDLVKDAVRQWLAKAEVDWTSVEILSESTRCPRPAVCYHCQQYVEKMLKAFLTLHQIEAPRTHDLRRLIQLAAPLARELNALVDRADALSFAGVQIRYPDNWREVSDIEMKAMIAGRRVCSDFVAATDLIDLPVLFVTFASWRLYSPLMDPFLQAAIDEAKLGLSEGGLPIGSVLVRNGQIIGRGHNRRVQQGDPMAHAEIDCMKNAGRQATYKDTILYSTLMPCFLCTGAAVQFGVPKVVVGESITFPGGESKWGRSGDFMEAAGIEVVNLHDETCIKMMRDFIAANPELWNEDIGVD